MTTIPHLAADSIYEHKLVDLDGKETSLEEYRGKVLLIVNVASRCGFTRQYKGLQKLYREFEEQGLVVCGFPCNQFGGQEPESEMEIKRFCSAQYGVTFPMYSKISVNGPERHPLYETLIGDASTTKGQVKWNFTKILVGRDGVPLARFGSLTFPSSGKLRKAIEKALQD